MSPPRANFLISLFFNTAAPLGCNSAKPASGYVLNGGGIILIASSKSSTKSGLAPSLTLKSGNSEKPTSSTAADLSKSEKALTPFI